MIVSSRAERVAVALLALARTVFCAYRAATQSITIDEASTYINYVRDHWANVWAKYDPNNHVLHSILAQLSVRAFHSSEFSLRLPSVLAGFFLIIGFHRVLEATVSSAAIRCIAVLGVSLAPLLLDFSVAARGYVLGIALLVWAINLSIRGRDFWAGVLGGLSVAATINLVYAVIALVACPLVLDKDKLLVRLRRSLAVAVPAAVVFLALWYPLLPQLNTSHFYVGLPTLPAALYDFVYLNINVIPGYSGWFASGDGIRAIQYFFLPAVMLFVIVVSARSFLRDKYSRRSLLPALALLISLACIVASHLILGLNYPIDRLGLYLLVLLALAWAIAAGQAPNLALRAANALLALLLIAQFSTQIQTRYLTLWQSDSAIDKVAARLRDEVRGKPPESVSVSAIWYLTPALEFYRHVYRITALQPVERREPMPLTGFDYYVVNLKDADVKAAPDLGHIVPLFSDDFSGVMLGK